MKRLVHVAVLALAMVSVSQAQDQGPTGLQSDVNVAADFANTSAASARSTSPTSLSDSRGLANLAEPIPAPPDPKFAYGSRDDFRWQLALGVNLIRFRSSAFYATAVGTNTSITYFTNDWLGVEGNVNTGFAPTIYQNEHVKYVGYGAGPKIARRGRQVEPWVHVLLGGAHILPQTADNSQSGFEVQVGGGADYRIFPHLSARLELDWVRTHLFGAWQNNAQADADIVLHF